MKEKIDVSAKRLDHFGVIASEISRLKIIEMIDEAIGSNNQEIVTTGECVAGMAMNCFGFLDYPLMLMPEFFEDKALSVLFGKDISADSFNRHKLGRVLDNISNYGCEKLFSELSFAVCMNERVSLNFQHCDTTTFSLTGQYLVEDMDVQEVVITHGYSKDQRRDCKQIVQELIVSQDGGVPLLTKSWSGNASDSKIFQARVRELVCIFKESNDLRCLIADSKLYSEPNAEQLSKINFITRIPSTINLGRETRDKALRQNAWTELDENYKISEYTVVCYGFAQRWIVVYSSHANKRAEKSVEKEVKKQEDAIKKALFHLQAKHFSCMDDARKALSAIAKKARYHTIVETEIKVHWHHAKKGRPTEGNAPQNVSYQIIGKAILKQEAIDLAIQRKSCFVLGTNMSSNELSPGQVLAAYKQQDKVEKGFAFLKSPSFFASSLFLKKTSRIQALIMIMTLALLIYSIVQRKLRIKLKETNETLPNQIKKPTATPTLRWIFQMIQGINYITIRINDCIQTTVDNITDLRKKILTIFGPEVCKIYKISCEGG